MKTSVRTNSDARRETSSSTLVFAVRFAILLLICRVAVARSQTATCKQAPRPALQPQQNRSEVVFASSE